MGDLRNKLRRLEQIERQKKWLAENCPPSPVLPLVRCGVCGLSYYETQVFCLQADRWAPVLYRCKAHLPEPMG